MHHPGFGRDILRVSDLFDVCVRRVSRGALGHRVAVYRFWPAQKEEDKGICEMICDAPKGR